LPKLAFALVAVAIIAIAGSTYLYLHDSDEDYLVPYKVVEIWNPNLFEVNLSVYLDGVPLPFCTNCSSSPGEEDFSCTSHIVITVPGATNERVGHAFGLLVPQGGQAWRMDSVVQMSADLYEDRYEFSTDVYPSPYSRGVDWSIHLEPTGWVVGLAVAQLF